MINPDIDEVTRSLASYLQTYLNEKSFEYYTANDLPPRIAVKTVCDHQTDLKAIADFPVLMIYRTRFFGDFAEDCEASIDYFLPVSIKTRVEQAARFNWIARHTAIALSEYPQTGDRCIEIELDGGYSATTRYAEVGGNGLVIPFLRGTFTFKDLEPVD